jgi:hypothetical protein
MLAHTCLRSRICPWLPSAGVTELGLGLSLKARTLGTQRGRGRVRYRHQINVRWLALGLRQINIRRGKDNWVFGLAGLSGSGFTIAYLLPLETGAFVTSERFKADGFSTVQGKGELLAISVKSHAFMTGIFSSVEVCA